MALTGKIPSSDSGKVRAVTEQMREHFCSSIQTRSCREEELCTDHSRPLPSLRGGVMQELFFLTSFV